MAAGVTHPEDRNAGCPVRVRTDGPGLSAIHGTHQFVAVKLK
jgi:hypothetical protein